MCRFATERESLLLLRLEEIIDVPKAVQDANNIDATGTRQVENQVVLESLDRQAAHSFQIGNAPWFAQAHLKFFDDGGFPLTLPWALAGSSTTVSSLDQTIAPHSRLVIASEPADGDPLQIGSAQLTTDGSASGFIRFRYGPRDQEAIVPIEARNSNSYILPFDNTNGLAAGVAIAGNSGAPATIPVLFRDDTGARIGVGTVSVPANGHGSFVLSKQFPVTSNVSGTAEFGAPAG